MSWRTTASNDSKQELWACFTLSVTKWCFLVLFSLVKNKPLILTLQMTSVFSFVCSLLPLQAGIWPTQPYLGTPLMFPPQARAATQPPRSLEWFLVSQSFGYSLSLVSILVTFKIDADKQTLNTNLCNKGIEYRHEDEKVDPFLNYLCINY